MGGLEQLASQGAPILVGVAVVVVIAAVAGAIRSMLGGRNEVVDRLEPARGRGDLAERLGNRPSMLSKVLEPIGRLARPKRAIELSRMRARLIQGGYRGPYAVEVFFALKIGLAVVLTMAFIQVNARLPNRLVFPYDLAVAVWICGGAFLIPNFFLASAIKKRQSTIERSLPDAMDLLVTCVEAGLGIDAALSRVSEEIGLASPLLGTELNLTFLEIQAGIPRADAFRRLAERTGVEDLRSLSATLIQTEMFGTSIARALRVHAEGMRVKRMQHAEENAAMVGVKMTIPLILCILPSLIAVLLGPAVVSIIKNLFPAMHQ